MEGEIKFEGELVRFQKGKGKVDTLSFRSMSQKLELTAFNDLEPVPKVGIWYAVEYKEVPKKNRDGSPGIGVWKNLAKINGKYSIKVIDTPKAAVEAKEKAMKVFFKYQASEMKDALKAAGEITGKDSEDPGTVIIATALFGKRTKHLLSYMNDGE